MCKKILLSIFFICMIISCGKKSEPIYKENQVFENNVSFETRKI